MKKTPAIALALCGVFALSSCEGVTWSQVQTQVLDMFTLDSTTAVIVGGVLEKHPESIDLFRKLSADIVKLTDKDVLTLDEVEMDLVKRIENSNLPCKDEIILAVSKVLDKISIDPNFDIAAHKDELLDISQGIDWALKLYAEKHAEPVVTIEK